jgi:hypothetical protein
MATIDSVDLIRSVEWGQGYLWSVRFSPTGLNNPEEVPDKPFDTWFPASTLDEDLFSVESFSFHTGGGAFRVPQRRSAKNVRMTFYDDVDCTLLGWFERWVNDFMFDVGSGRDFSTVTPLEGCVRQLEVNRLDSSRNPVGSSRQYLVYPEGGLTFRGGSHAEARIFPISLVIVGGASTPLNT